MRTVLSRKHYKRAWLFHVIQRIKDLKEPKDIAENDVKQKGLAGEYGKIQQFWLKYIELIDSQQQFRFAINANDFALKLHSWDQSLPLCFATTRVHYERYGTYYLQHYSRT